MSQEATTTLSKAQEAARDNPFQDVSFQDPPSESSRTPPPSYVPAPSAGGFPVTPYPFAPKDGFESPSAHYHRQARFSRRRILCIVLALLILLVILLTVLGAVFHWGNSRLCIRWDDGTTTGDCSANH